MTEVSRTGYAICAVMRSGSTWLAELLSSTSVLGRPSEYFSTQIQQTRLVGVEYPTDRRAQVAYILEKGATPNGVYGFKMFPVYFNEVAREIGWASAFPGLHYVHLQRRDLVGQAISRVRAQQTRQWRSNLSALDTPIYDGEAIFAALEAILVQDARWTMYFALNRIEPLRLVYEEMIETPQRAVNAVADLIGVSPRPAVDVDGIKVEVQRDALTAEWRERFLSTYADRNRLYEL